MTSFAGRAAGALGFSGRRPSGCLRGIAQDGVVVVSTLPTNGKFALVIQFVRHAAHPGLMVLAVHTMVLGVLGVLHQRTPAEIAATGEILPGACDGVEGSVLERFQLHDAMVLAWATALIGRLLGDDFVGARVRSRALIRGAKLCLLGDTELVGAWGAPFRLLWRAEHATVSGISESE